MGKILIIKGASYTPPSSGGSNTGSNTGGSDTTGGSTTGGGTTGGSSSSSGVTPESGTGLRIYYTTFGSPSYGWNAFANRTTAEQHTIQNIGIYYDCGLEEYTTITFDTTDTIKYCFLQKKIADLTWNIEDDDAAIAVSNICGYEAIYHGQVQTITIDPSEKGFWLMVSANENMGGDPSSDTIDKLLAEVKSKIHFS